MKEGGSFLLWAVTALACTVVYGETLVRVGDSTDAVRNHMGEPNLEFPLNGQLVQDYGHCVITSENGVVIAIRHRDQVETPEAQNGNAAPAPPTINGLLSKAREGDADSQFCLGYCYQSGEVVKKNIDEAIRWYTFAAMQGHVDAQHNLGCIYMKGEGVPRDYEQAYTWAVLAAGNGNNQLMKMLGSRVTEDQKSTAFARAERIRDGLEESPYGEPDEATAIARTDAENAAAAD
jgi:hypothetical protein